MKSHKTLSSSTFRSSTLLFVIFVCTVHHLHAQTNITGTVTDQRTGKPLENVNIIINPSSQGTVTNASGEFSLQYTGAFPVTLTFTHIAHESLSETIKQPQNLMKLNITMVPKVLNTPEVTIIGSRSRASQDISSSTEITPLRQIDQRGIRDIGEALQESESVRIESDNRGHQTLSIRGSNPDEAAVFLDGVKINQVSTGVARLEFIDLSNLESMEVIKGGGTVMFGGGNFGGVVLLQSRSPDKNSIRIKTSSGLTTDKDQDRSIAGDVKWGPIGIGIQVSGKSRLYDGRTSFLTQYRNLSGQYSTLRNDIILRHIDLGNTIQFHSGGVINSDQFQVDRLEWNYRQSPQNGWSLEGGQKKWIWKDNFYSNLSRNVEEKSQSIVVNKAFSFQSLEGNLQFENENQKYLGDQLASNRYISQYSRDTTLLNQKETAIAASLRYNGTDPVPGIHLVRIECGFRYSNVHYNELQNIEYFENDILSERDTVKVNDSLPMKTLRLGVAANTQWLGQDWNLFFNAGDNVRLPNMSDRLLWGVAKKTIQDEYNRVLHIVPTTDYLAQLKQDQLQHLEPILHSFDQGFLPENLSMLEASLSWDRDWIKPSVMDHLEIGFSIFQNFYINKVAYYQVENSLVIPYNAYYARMNGWESSIKTSLFSNLIRVQSSYTRLYPGNPAAFPGKPSSEAHYILEIGRSWLKINISHLWQGPQKYLDSGVSLQALKTSSNTNLNLVLSKQLYFIKTSLNYTVRNVFSNKNPIMTSQSVNSSDPFNYYDRHRELLTLSFSYDGKKK